MDELAVELGRDPMDVRGRTGSSTRSSRSPRSPGCTTTPATTRRPPPRRRSCSTTTGCAASSRSAATGTTRCSSASASRRSPRCAGWRRRGGGARWATAPAAGSTRAIRMLPLGKVEVVTGVSAHGQGHETAWSQIVADQLGVPFEDVEVLHGDTQVSPKGLDTYGSRSLAVGGIAVVKAAEKVVAKARKVAAHLLEASEDDLEFAGGRSGCGARTRAWRSGRSRSRRSRRTTSPRAWSRRSTPTPRSTRRRSPSRTARTSPRWRSTPRRAGRRCAATSASTTSARW